jgi:hypothetical protein
VSTETFTDNPQVGLEFTRVVADLETQVMMKGVVTTKRPHKVVSGQDFGQVMF